MKSECLKLSVMTINNSLLTEEKTLTSMEICDELRHKLTPAINSVNMIAQMLEQETLGPVDLGPYKQYIEDLKECALTQDLFARDLATYMRKI
jgi:hypothetical protein